MSRRRLPASAPPGGGARGGSLALPPNVRRALAAPAPTWKGPGDIEHVVILTQENRSFDHYFGTLAGVRGFGDPAAARLANGRSLPLPPFPGAEQTSPAEEPGRRPHPA
jgi:phospholipase C